MSMVRMGQISDESMKGMLWEVEAHQLQFLALRKRLIREFKKPESEGFITSSSRSIQFEIQAALIPDKHKFEYQSARELVRIVEGFRDFWFKEYFIYFHGISDSEYEAIERELRRAGLRGMVRFTFENALDAAILRISPGPERYVIGGHFALELLRKIPSIPGHDRHSVLNLRDTLFRVPGVRSKEGDQCFQPDTRSGEAWPSLMMEVGHQKGLKFLRLDAEWWLVNSHEQTRLVIIIKIDRDPFALHIECWMMAETSRRQTTHTPDKVPRCVQEFDTDAAGGVTSSTGSTELQIPYDSIFDEIGPDPPLPPITFSFSELSSFALWMFQQLHE